MPSVDKVRQREVPLLLSPSCVTQKKTSKKKWPRGHGRLREKRNTRRLQQSHATGKKKIYAEQDIFKTHLLCSCLNISQSTGNISKDNSNTGNDKLITINRYWSSKAAQNVSQQNFSLPVSTCTSKETNWQGSTKSRKEKKKMYAEHDILQTHACLL